MSAIPARDLRNHTAEVLRRVESGEEIEVLELPFHQALAMIGDGRIADAKTIMLLQYAALNIFR